jgi:flagellar basal body-associated protein FliL
MAENNETTSEQTTDEEQAPSKGLSTSLLIKVAIGLGVVLIALVVTFFLMSQNADDATDAEAEFQSQVEPVADGQATEGETETGQAPEAPPSSDEPGATSEIELPATPDETPQSAELAAPTTEPSNAEAPISSTSAQGSDNLLAEIVSLQQQVVNLQKENQDLIKRVQDLAKENESLKARVEQLAGSPAVPATASGNDVINDQRLVNQDEVPLYYRQHPYRDKQQIELKPKWGDFKKPDNG